MASTKRYFNKKGEVVSIQIRVFRGMDENGKQLKPYQKSVRVPKGATERQIQKLEQEQAVLFEHECRAGVILDDSILFRDFAKEVLDIKRVGGIAESTLARYQEMVDERLNPYFGYIKVREITGKLLNRFYGELSKPGQNKRTGGALSAKTILEYHRLLSVIFREAKKQHIITSNPAEDATPPKVHHKTPNYFQPEQLELIRQAFDAQPIKWRTLGYLFMLYGDRRSEFAAIKRKNIDFVRHQLYLTGGVLYHPSLGVYEKATVKNEKDRYLPMPPQIEGMLQEYLSWLDAEREKWGDQWIETEYIFTGERGGIINPDTITRYFARMSATQQKMNPDFPHVNPHAFRHTVTSLLLSNGMDWAAVASYVGDDPATLARFYVHFISGGKIDAVNAMTGMIGLPKQQNSASTPELNKTE